MAQGDRVRPCDVLRCMQEGCPNKATSRSKNTFTFKDCMHHPLFKLRKEEKEREDNENYGGTQGI